MEPVHTLAEALAGMRWRVEPGRFAIVGLPDGDPADRGGRGAGGPGAPGALGPLVEGLPAPFALVREPGETTLVAREEALAPFLERLEGRAGRPAARVERGWAWIRFELPMAWDLVGFLGRVGSRLAEAGVPIAAVSSHARDHVLVPAARLDAARGALESLFGPALEAPATPRD